MRAIVIGSGVGGLAVAIRLAVKGYQVQVFERNAAPGGKLSLLQKNGYFFDAGPSLFTQPRNIEELFELAGEPMEPYFRFRAVPIACRYFFDNGKMVNAFTHRDLFARELENVLGENPLAVKQYLERAEKAYHAIGNIFLEHSLHKPSTWLNRRILPAISNTRLRYLTDSLHRFNASGFRNPATTQIFDRFATYNGSNPYRAPAMLSMIPHLEQNEGAFYPEGGMISIPRALYALAVKKGVEFHFSTPVESIMQAKGRVYGVIAGGKEYSAGTVVSNADVYYVYRDLLRQDHEAARVLKRERSSSALIFYWGMKKSFPALHLHNIFFSSDYAEEFRQIFTERTLYNDPTVYVNITAKMEARHAPEGGENWFVMLNAPADSGHDWPALMDRARVNILSKLSRMMGEDISAAIDTELTQDPKGIEAGTLSHMGSLYGTSSNSRLAAFLRHANFRASLKGMYFTGGSVHPGGGIPLSLKSAKIVAEMCKG